MTTYSVKEIADLLGTSQETVRRWIRDGKLQAVDDTKRKGENKVILEDALRSFLKTSPKYAGVIAGTLSVGGGVGAAALGLMGVSNALLAIKKAEVQALSQARIDADSVYAFLATKISEERSKLEKMLDEQKELDQKIQIQTDVLNQLVDNLKKLNGVTVNPGTEKKEDAANGT